jgi:hypothetical protein
MPAEPRSVTEPLALLLLPSKLEEFELADHARDLLAIPRVLALEPGRFRTPRFLREAVAARGGRRLRLPGEPRLLVLYHPRQYPLARALCARYEQAELWYLRPNDPAQTSGGDRAEELSDLDRLARERATETRIVNHTAAPSELREPLRRRLLELEVISHRPFVPGARVHDL